MFVFTCTVYLFIHVHEHILTWPSLTCTWNFTVGLPLVYPTKWYCILLRSAVSIKIMKLIGLI